MTKVLPQPRPTAQHPPSDEGSFGRVNATRTQPERATACGNDGGRDEVPYFSSVTPPARLLFPAGVTAAHRSLEPFDEVRILGGEPHQSHSGTPNPSSRFGVKAIRNFEVNLSPQWTPYGARCSVNGFSPLLFPVAPEQPSRARSGVRLQPCGKGRHRRLRQPGWRRSAKPCMAGFDSRNRLSSDTDKRDGYMPPLVSGFAVSEGSSDQ